MSVTGSDLALFARDLALNTREFVADYVGKAIAGITDRFEQQIATLKELRAVPGPVGQPGPVGPPGRDGVDADPVRIKADVRSEVLDALRAEMAAMMRDLIREEVDRRMAGVAMPRDGRDGKDADLTLVKAWIEAAAPVVPDLAPLVRDEVAKAFAASPPRDGRDGANGIDGKDGTPGLDGKDGANGLDGKDGRDGLDGKDGASVTLGDVQPFITAELSRLVAALPPAKDGRDGQPGTPGLTGPMGPQGEKGRDGIDGKDGRDGLDGKDGTTFERFELVLDEQAGPIIHLKQGEQSLSWPLPSMWDAGVWRAGKQYPQGAGVSWNGSLWIAQKDTHGEKPGDGSGVWRLAVKAGRDAKPRE